MVRDRDGFAGDVVDEVAANGRCRGWRRGIGVIGWVQGELFKYFA